MTKSLKLRYFPVFPNSACFLQKPERIAVIFFGGRVTNTRDIKLTVVFGAAFAFFGCNANFNRSPDGNSSFIKSLTGESYTGKKYYLGYGGMADNDEQTNEINYDVKHTNEIFTKELGGQYIGTTLIYPKASRESVLGKMKEIRNTAGPDDMYVQYSSGHGMESGAQAGGDFLDYSEIRDNALAMKAKEVVIFLMSCNSGGLTDSFNEKKSEWQDWPSKGRSLFVMSSSTVSESSSSGPGTDKEESGGENGSAGSAFGHYLWKGLMGDADGYVDGVVDGFVSLQELALYARDKTRENFGHTPQFTGAYNPYAIMDRAPRRPNEIVQNSGSNDNSNNNNNNNNNNNSDNSGNNPGMDDGSGMLPGMDDSMWP